MRFEGRGMKFLAVTLLFGALLVSGCGRSAEFGVVDMGKVERESPIIVEIKAKGQKELGKLQAEMEKDLAGKTGEARLKVIQEYQTRAQIVQSSIYNNVQNQLQGVVHQVAMEKGLGAVLVKESALDGGVDLTDLVLKKLQPEVADKKETADKKAEAGSKEVKK